jgi:hypothetical protein
MMEGFQLRLFGMILYSVGFWLGVASERRLAERRHQEAMLTLDKNTRGQN